MKTAIALICLVGGILMVHDEKIDIDLQKMPLASSYGLGIAPIKDTPQVWDRNWPKGKENMLCVTIKNTSQQPILYLDSPMATLVCAILKDGTVFRISFPEYGSESTHDRHLQPGETVRNYFVISPKTVSEIKDKAMSIRIVITIYDANNSEIKVISHNLNPSILQYIIPGDDRGYIMPK